MPWQLQPCQAFARRFLVPTVLTTALATTVLAQAAIAAPMLVSWYGPGFEGGYTANGEVFSRYDYTAAHPSWPFNTLVQLTNPDTGAVVTVRINDRSGGSLDISEQAARDPRHLQRRYCLCQCRNFTVGRMITNS